MESAVDAERAWREYETSVDRPELKQVKPFAHIRVNPGLPGPTPKLDANDELPSLQFRVAQDLRSPPLKLMVLQSVLQLVASTFYFSKISPPCITEACECVGQFFPSLQCPRSDD